MNKLSSSFVLHIYHITLIVVVTFSTCGLWTHWWFEKAIREQKLAQSLHKMSEYGFSLTHIFPYKDRIFDSILIRKKYRSEKTLILTYFTRWIPLKTIQNAFKWYGFYIYGMGFMGFIWWLISTNTFWTVLFY